MRHWIFLVIMLVFNTSCATAQQYSSSYDDVYTDNSSYDDKSAYNVVLDDDLVLTDRQWHTDDYSILEADGNQYVLLRGTDKYRYHLGRLNYSAYSRLFGDVIVESNCRPYYYDNQFGWFVSGSRGTYFVYPDGRSHYFRDRYYPRYYDDYYYPVRHSRCLNIFSWHFWSGRHHRDYRGHCYDRPRYNHNDRPYVDHRSSYSRNSGSSTRRSSVNSTRTRASSGSNYQRSESSSRRSSSYSQPSTRSRSEGSYSRSSSSSRPSSSYSRSSSSGSSRSSSVSTRSSSGSSSRSSATSSGSSRRR